jgi:protein ImuA
MSRGGVSERIVFLRRQIAALETGDTAAGPPPAPERGDPLERLLDHCRRGACEILPARPTDAAAAAGFAFALALRCARRRPQAGIVWIAEDMVVREIGLPYGRGLQAAGLSPERLLLARTRRPADSLWAMEEALKSAPAAVVAESWASPGAYGLSASRRLALAARRGGSAGLLLLPRAAGAASRLAGAAEARFEIASLSASSRGEGARPLPGPPAFRLRVVKARGLVGAFDPQAWRDVFFDHEEAEFHALPRHSPAAPFDRPHPAPAIHGDRACA